MFDSPIRNDTYGVYWLPSKKDYIGQIGQITRQEFHRVIVLFGDNISHYPISLIEPHLIEEENNDDTSNQNDDTSLVKCGECNKHYRCTTCDADCGTDGHYVEKEPHLIEETPEIPQLGEGVLMQVSDNGVVWVEDSISAIAFGGRYVGVWSTWKHARPILPKYTHAELVEKLGHEFEYGGKDE